MVEKRIVNGAIQVIPKALDLYEYEYCGGGGGGGGCQWGMVNGEW